MKKRIALLLCLVLTLTAVTSTALADFHWPWEKPGSDTSQSEPAPAEATKEPVAAKPASVPAATGAFYDMAFTLEGDAYTLPMPYRSLTKNGWKISESYADPETETIGGEMYTTISQMQKKNAHLQIRVYNLGTSEIKLADCTVGEISIDATACRFDFAGITEKTTEAQLVARLGKGEAGTDGDVTVHMYGGAVRRNVYFEFNKGVMQRVIITGVYPVQEYAPTKVQNALMAAYQQPTATDFVGFEAVETLLVTKPVYELFGKLYELPTPLGAFMADGWKLFYAKTETDGTVSGRGWTDAYLYRGDSLLQLRCHNPSDSAVHISDCVAVGVGSTFMDDAITSESTFMNLRLPGGIDTGLTFTKAKALFGDWIKGSENSVTVFTADFENDIELSLYFDEATGLLTAMGMEIE